MIPLIVMTFLCQESSGQNYSDVLKKATAIFNKQYLQGKLKFQPNTKIYYNNKASVIFILVRPDGKFDDIYLLPNVKGNKFITCLQNNIIVNEKTCRYKGEEYIFIGNYLN